MQTDSFLNLLTDFSNHPEIDRSYIAFRSGHWLRISLSMHLKRHTELGHPNADSLWDFNGFIANCFDDLGLKVKVYLSKMRNTMARQTRADESKILHDNVVYFDGVEELDRIIGEVRGIITSTTGEFVSTQDTTEAPSTLHDLPLGPVIIEVLDAEPKHDTPWESLLYWSWVFERGEEPTEVVGTGGYSSVSGWKAYARWMQGYLLPPKKNTIHPNLSNLPSILIDRTSSAIPYLDKLIAEEENENILENYSGFRCVIDEVQPLLLNLNELYQEHASHKAIRSAVSEVYFCMQKTLPIFKSMKNLYHDYVIQRR